MKFGKFIHSQEIAGNKDGKIVHNYRRIKVHSNRVKEAVEGMV